jgi:S-DNA-T family DNA segregation ATPase FtsK/SpoIIIE
MLWAIVAVWVFRRVTAGVETFVDDDYGATLTFGLVVVLPLLLGLAGALAYQRLRSVRPWLWWPTVGAAVAVGRLARSWAVTCDELELSIPGASRFAVVGGGRRGGGVILKGKPLQVVPPRRVRLWFTGCSLILTVRLHPGQTPSQYEKAAEAFSHAWRVHRVRAYSRKPGFVTLTGLGFDPLRYPPTPAVAIRRQEESRELSDDLIASSFASRAESGTVTGDLIVPGVLIVSVGVREDGAAWLVNAGRHLLVTGATRSGKSTLTVRLISELSRRPVCLVGIDCKAGMELSPFGPRLSALAMSRSEAVAAIEALLVVLGVRSGLCRREGVRSVWDLRPGIRPAPVVVVVDEIAELFLSADKDGKAESARCVSGLVRLAQLGSALGIFLWVSGQRFGSDLGSGATLLRAQLSGRVCHRVADAETARMTLAGLPGEAVEEALRIPMDLAGVAVAGDDSGDWFMGRSHPLSVEAAADVAREHASLRVPLPDVAEAIEAVRRQEGHG